MKLMQRHFTLSKKVRFLPRSVSQCTFYITDVRLLLQELWKGNGEQ